MVQRNRKRYKNKKHLITMKKICGTSLVLLRKYEYKLSNPSFMLQSTHKLCETYDH